MLQYTAHIMRFFCIFAQVILFLCNSFAKESEVVIIGKPELQCGDHGDIVKSPINITEIRLPKNVEALFSVNSERLFGCINNGNCMLMTWNVIRGLESFLNRNYNNTGPTGIIKFSNHMIIPGFNYLLHVIMKKSPGSFIEKDFNLTFAEEQLYDEKTAFVGSLDLNTEISDTYSSLPIVVNANVTLCGDIVHYYYFRWFLVTDGQEIELPGKSSELSILPGSKIIENVNFCKIKCMVLDSENNSMFLEASIEINIRDPIIEKSPEVFMPFKYTTYNKGAPISIQPYISFSKLLEYQTEWSCLLNHTLLYECQGQANDEFYLESGFNQEGNYTITVLIIAENIEATATCNIIVVSEVPSIEFYMPYPIKPHQEIEITARISELRTYCTVQWGGDSVDDFQLENTIGLKNNIFNISSKDQTFLEEMVELGQMTVSRDFRLKIPQPSRNWSGLESRSYQVTLTVICPSFNEISNENIVQEQPTSFVTIHGETVFFVPPSPNVKALVIFSDQNEALRSKFTCAVQLANGNIQLDSMLLKYGFILEGVDVIFYTGINAWNSRTILPYNGDLGVEIYVEVCDCKNRCRRKFGRFVNTVLNYDYSEELIFHTFMQKLIEEDYYKVFSYVFLVQHSLGFINKSEIFTDIFSRQLLNKMENLLAEDNTSGLNSFLESVVKFIDHIKLCDYLLKKLFSMTHELLSSEKGQLLSRFTRSADISGYPVGAKLERIESFIKMSEYAMPCLNKSEEIVKEQTHYLDLIDQWMIEACVASFNGQRVPKVDMKSAELVIEKISSRTLKHSLKMPRDNYVWNITTYLNLSDLSLDSNLCFGYSKLKYFLHSDIAIGINIYSCRPEEVKLGTHPHITIGISHLEAIALQCDVYNKGSTFTCSVSRPFPNYMECICSTFGYFYLGFQNNSFGTNLSNNINESFGESGAKFKKQRRLGDQISYVMILSSTIGVCILCYILRQLTVVLQQNVENEEFTD